MFMPTHQVIVVHNDGRKESIMCADISTIKELKQEVQNYVQYLIKKNNTCYEDWKEVQYCNSKDQVLCAMSIDEVMKID